MDYSLFIPHIFFSTDSVPDIVLDSGKTKIRFYSTWQLPWYTKHCFKSYWCSVNICWKNEDKVLDSGELHTQIMTMLYYRRRIVLILTELRTSGGRKEISMKGRYYDLTFKRWVGICYVDMVIGDSVVQGASEKNCCC